MTFLLTLAAKDSVSPFQVADVTQQLKNPPIREAVLDVHVDIPGDLDQIKTWVATKVQEFDVCKPLHQLTWHLNINEDSDATRDGGQIGWRFEYGDQIIAQVKSSGFSVSMLPPYSRWAELLQWAKKFADALESQPVIFNRLGVRYINEFPAMGLPPERIFVNPPNSARPNSESRRYMYREETESAGVKTIVTQVFEGGQHNRVILDIDVMMPDSTWADLETLRKTKNVVFFEALTPQMISEFHK